MQRAVWGTPRICVHVGLCHLVACVTFEGTLLGCRFVFSSVEGHLPQCARWGDPGNHGAGARVTAVLTITVRPSGNSPVSARRVGSQCRVPVMGTVRWW